MNSEFNSICVCVRSNPKLLWTFKVSDLTIDNQDGDGFTYTEAIFELVIVEVNDGTKDTKKSASGWLSG